MSFKYLLSDSEYGVVDAKTDSDMEALDDILRDNLDFYSSKIMLYLVKNSIKTPKHGDSLFCAGTIVITEGAREALEEIFEDYGSFIPVHVEGLSGNYYIYNVTNLIDCLDTDKSIFSTAATNPNIIMNIKEAVLRADLVGNNKIFRLTNGPADYVFIHEDIEEKIKSTDLTGFRFGELDYYKNPAKWRLE